MPMLSFLDHDDFKKSRKAVFIVASLVVFSEGISIEGQLISFSSIEINASQRGISLALNGALIYFFTVFLIRAFGEFLKLKERTIEAESMFIKEFSDMIASAGPLADLLVKNRRWQSKLELVGFSLIEFGAAFLAFFSAFLFSEQIFNLLVPSDT